MTPRERIEAAFRREPCDHVPFTPILDGYFQASLPGGSELDPVDLQADLAGHVLSRIGAIRINTPLWLASVGVKKLATGINERFSRQNGDILHSVETPVGSLTWRLRFTPESPFIPWVIEHRIRTVEDVKTFQYLVGREDLPVPGGAHGRRAGHKPVEEPE
jgi:hypothetical protein